jgi:hypothetical protein
MLCGVRGPGLGPTPGGGVSESSLFSEEEGKGCDHCGEGSRNRCPQIQGG